jgi:hypothetical protein
MEQKRWHQVKTILLKKTEIKSEPFKQAGIKIEG